MVLIVTASLLFGAASNVGLAWWLAYAHWDIALNGATAMGWTSNNAPGWWYRRFDGFGSVRIDGTGVSARTARGNTSGALGDLPSGSVFADPPADSAARMRIVEDARGWPWPSLASVYEVGPGPGWPPWKITLVHGRELTNAAQGAAPINPTMQPAESLPQALPMRILWRGFILNTLVHSALWLPLIMVFVFAMSTAFGFKKRRRRKRGWCLACAYDLKGDYEAGCPECGWQRDPRVDC